VNAAVGRELTLIDAFDQGAPLLRSRLSKALIRRFRGQEQEHLNGLTKTIRGLSADLEGEAEELDFSQVKSERDLLLLVYRLTSTNLTAYLEAVPHLATTAPRAISASIAANEAEHLVVLRQALGAAAPASIPEAFDTGEVPPPAAAPSGASARSQTPGSAR
jgi:rubrerythrin